MENKSCRNCMYHFFAEEENGTINTEGPGVCTYLLPVWATEDANATDEIKDSLCAIPIGIDHGPKCMVWRRKITLNSIVRDGEE